MSLLEGIRKQLNTPTAPDPNSGTQTETVRGLLRAKSGKAGASSSGPRQSNLQELSADNQTQAGMDQIGLRGRIQGEQLAQRGADIEQRGEQAEQSFQESFKDAEAHFKRNSDNLLGQLERGQMSLGSEKYISNLHQLGFQTRLQSEQYVNKLQTEGTKNRLNNSLEFKKHLAKSVMKDQYIMFADELEFDSLMEADDREFMEEMAEKDINFAMEVADNEINAQNTRDQISAGTDILSTAATIGVKSAMSEEKDDN